MTQRGSPATPAQIAKVDNFRTQWEQFWFNGTSGRSHMRTSLVKAARVSPLPAAALAGLSSDASLREALGAAGRSRVAESFSVEQMVEAYVRLYESVLGEWAKRRHRA